MRYRLRNVSNPEPGVRGSPDLLPRAAAWEHQPGRDANGGTLLRLSHSRRWSLRGVGWCLLVVVLAGVCASAACSYIRPPSLVEQEAMILDRDIQLNALSLQAFLNTWGPPNYGSREYTEFYPVENGNWIPQFRVPLGEPPPGWTHAVVREEGQFLGYVDRGELLGFVAHELVFRERLSPEEIHRIGKNWSTKSRFRTNLERLYQ